MTHKTYRNSITRNERIILGCRATVESNISDIARDYNTNRQFVYNQKKKIEHSLSKSFDIPQSNVTSLVVTDEIIRKIIFGCMVTCKGSTENTQEFIKQIFGIHVSIGKISNIINSFAHKAKEFNDTVCLDKIKVGANDEIFQAGVPVLVGVDVYSTYIYLMNESATRNATDWALALLEKKEQGLNLHTSVNDGATGLRKGVCDAFPKINIQSDIFHALRKIYLGIIALERATYKNIAKEYSLEEKCLKGIERNNNKYFNEYIESSSKAIEMIEIYDQANTLYSWIREAFEIGGEFYDERIFILDYTTNELERLETQNAYIKAAISYLRNHKNDLLTFIQLAQKEMVGFSVKEEIDSKVLFLMWEQKKYSTSSSIYNILEAKIGTILGDKYTRIREGFSQLIEKVVRASSIVECINSLIRPYLFLKRTVNDKFLDLLQFYFNTRKYRRSRCKDRKGKSPIEVLTGEYYDHPLELLGY